MADKEELKIQQELLVAAEANVELLEKSYQIKFKSRRLAKESIDQAKKLANFMFEETQFAAEGATALRTKSELLAAHAKSKSLELKTALEIKTQENLGTKAAKDRAKILKGVEKQNKKITENIAAQAENRDKLNKQMGVMDNAVRGMANTPFIGQFIETDAILGSMEKKALAGGSQMQIFAAGGKALIKSLDGSGPLLMIGAFYKMMKFIVGLAFKLDKQITQIQTSTGLTRDASHDLHKEMQGVAEYSGKVYMTSTKLVETFATLTESTGLIANFGGSFLETMTDLTDRLGMSAEEAQKLAFLTNLQGKDGDKVLSNQIETVNLFNKQNRLGITAKGIFKDIANTSAEVQVALGQSVSELTDGALAAKKLGLSMDEVFGAAGGFLDFQSSIQKELEFSLATNQEVSFAKERQMALDNDMVGLAEALANKESVLLAFRTGNRIEMDLAAGAMNMSSSQLAKIIQQQDYLNMSTAEYSELYGEQSLKSMQELDAQEKIAAAMAKIKDRLMIVGETMLPVIEGFSSLVSWISQSQFAITMLVGVMGTLAAAAFAFAIAKAWSSAMALGPLLGPAAAIVTTGLIFGAASQIPAVKLPSPEETTPEVKPIQMKDGTLSGIKIKTLPQDSIEIDKSSGRVAVGTNLNGNSKEDNFMGSQQMISILENINRSVMSNKSPSSVVFDSYKYRDRKTSGGSANSHTKYKTAFV